MDYFDFELEIGAASANAYPVTVIRSPAGEAHETLHLPFDEQALSTQLLTLQQALAGSGQMGSPSLATGEQTIQGFGQALFGALFTGQVRDLYVASRTAAQSQGKGLRVKLRLQPPELSALPWEFLYDADQGQYLCLSDKTPLVRYIELPAPCQPLSVTPPLCILGMTASPKDLPELDVAREQQRITTALAPLQSKGLAQVTWLTGHTWEDLQQALLAGPWHIFHFIGHGGFAATTHEGVIALEDQAGQSHYLSATQLGTLLADHQTLRLVVLNSCKGARSDTRASFSSTASQLVRHGIPAVLAHQYDISDEAAIALSRTFYAALAAGLPVDTAVGEARKAISLGGGRSLEWATPVLHLHTPDGVLFHLTVAAGPTVNIRQTTPSPTGSSPVHSAAISSAQAASLPSIQEPLAASLVRIRTTDGRVVGAGFLVSARQILTCAHVISQTLELPDGAVDLPQTAVSLDFPFVPPRTLFTAKVVVWRPPLADGRDDIAGLELQGEPPAGAEVVRFAEAADVWEHSFRAFGFPAGYDDGVWATGRLLGRQATDWIVIEDVKAQGFAVAPGFSGAPVWDSQLQGVVGMVVAASQPADTKAAFVIPLDVLVAAWPFIEPITRQRIFLSAAPTDTAFADRLRTDLQARDIVVWTEQHTPDSGQSNKEEGIRQAIRAAQAVVLVVSSQTRASRTVKEHLRLCDLYSRRLILVWTGEEPAQPQRYGWRETILVDAHTTPYKEALAAIEANLDRHRSISAMLGSAHAIPEEEQKEPRNPYKGLRAFTANDAGDFFGRDRLVDELVKDVEKLIGPEQAATENGRLLTILGPSGSGKSSVVMAGLLPRLQRAALPGSETWVYLEPMVPGKHPIEALGLTLARHFPERSFTSLREDLSDDATRGLHILATQLVKQGGSKVVLLVDQFEELFTQTESEEERQRFIDLLLTATTEPRGPLLVLLTLRADFSHHLIQYPALYRLVKAHEKPLFPMEVDDLRATVEQPAALPDVQLTFEGNLVGDLLFEIQGQVGALPLLQFTLEQLFERRCGHRLTLSAYREIGGVKGALSRHAEATYTALPSEEHRKLARALFVRLIDPGATEQDTTRRRAMLSEFTLADATQTRLMRETIDSFIAARLLTTNEVAETTTIEVSHEAVIREWKRLADWMREARQDIPLQQAISEDVAEWERRNKPKDRLYRGSQLKEARAWAKRNVPSSKEVVFLQTSSAHQTRSRVSIAALLLLFGLAVGLVMQVMQAQQAASLTKVTNRNDAGPGSLRQAINNALAGSTITFDPAVRGTILLTSGNLNIGKNLTIKGPGAGTLAISSGSRGFFVQIDPGASVAISGLAFTHSTIGGFDGSAITNRGKLFLFNSIVSDNTAASLASAGGGIYNTGTLTITNSTVSNNTASHVNNAGEGGGIYNTGTLTITNSIVSNNTAEGGPATGNYESTGGGIYDYGGGQLIITNSIVAGNMADDGGGIFCYDNNSPPTRVDLTFDTIYGNTAPRGGDIDCDGGSAKISNSIVAAGPAYPGLDIIGTLTSGGYNLFQDNSGAPFDPVTGALHSTDKTLSVNDLTRVFADSVVLRDNGDPTKIFALAPDSPAIDAIPLQYCQVQSIFSSQSRMYTDQRGVKRPDGNELFCDIGAYEYTDSSS